MMKMIFAVTISVFFAILAIETCVLFYELEALFSDLHHLKLAADRLSP